MWFRFPNYKLKTNFIFTLKARKISPRLTFLLFFASDIVKVEVVRAQCPKTNGTNKDDAYDWSEMSHDMFDSLVNGAVPIILLVAQSAGNDNIVVRVMDTLLLIVTPYVMPIVILWKFDECQKIIIWVKVLRTIGSSLSIPRIFTIHKHVNWTDKIASIATIPMYIADIVTWRITLSHENLDGILFKSYFVFLGVAFLISCSVLVIFIFTFDNTSTTKDEILSNSISIIFGIFTLINLMLTLFLCQLCI